MAHSMSWNEIRDRAIRFSREWHGECREDAEKQSFWNEFFDVFGIPSGQVEEVRKQLQTRKNYEQELKTYRARIRYLEKILPHQG